MTDIVVSTRPTPGTPRAYEFPSFERNRLSNGLTLITVNLPRRPLVSASLVIVNGAVDEPADSAGATILAARALAEGTERYDAIALIEASERLGASLHTDASWDAMSAGVEVPASRLGSALELLAELVHHPTFPASEVDRLRDERLNDLLQARADPRRRAEEVFAETIYTADSPYHRPAGGSQETVERLDREILRMTYRRGLDPARSTFVVAGDLTGIDVAGTVERLFGTAPPSPEATSSGPIVARSAVQGRRVRLIHRPGSVQTEIRIGHIGLPRRIPDFAALSVMGAVLGGLFNSRLNMKLREEKGYTYGASAGWDLRRGPGPFGARAAVNTEVTTPGVLDILAELGRIRAEPVTEVELRAARDFLIGVFPIRFETPGAVLGALAGLAVHGLPDDELTRYRERIDAVTAVDVLTAARAHLDLERMAIVMVGDADTIATELADAGLGMIDVEREPPGARGPEEPLEEQLGPVDAEVGIPIPLEDNPLREPTEEPDDVRPA